MAAVSARVVGCPKAAAAGRASRDAEALMGNPAAFLGDSLRRKVLCLHQLTWKLWIKLNG